MNYIGSKHKLSSFLKKAIKDTVGSDLSQLVFCDLFAGTGIVGRNFKPLVKQIIANDVEFYSYVLNRNYIGNYTPLKTQNHLAFLNNLEGKEGFIFHHYCENGNEERLYFSSENGKKNDGIRQQIEAWKRTKEISEDAYYFLLASLIESADKESAQAKVEEACKKMLANQIMETYHFTIENY